MNSKQAKITSRNCKQQLQARSEFKTRQIMKLLNQKAKVPFFIFLTETNLWLSLRLVKMDWRPMYYLVDNSFLLWEGIEALFWYFTFWFSSWCFWLWSTFLCGHKRSASAFRIIVWALKFIKKSNFGKLISELLTFN